MREERGSRDNLQDIKEDYKGREKPWSGGPISYSTNPDGPDLFQYTFLIWDCLSLGLIG